ncbi:hypothetical protein MRB53_037832 [Persea americana]|nr:hypothetical protein MRB53_037832 [Persea americana]
MMRKPVSAVLANADQHGYTILFSDASISDLKSSTSTSQLSLPSEAFEAQPNAEIAMIAEEKRPISDQLDAVNAVRTEVMERSIEDDRSVVRPEHLAEIFETGLDSASLPSVHDMFSAITGLFGRKSLSKPCRCKLSCKEVSKSQAVMQI